MNITREENISFGMTFSEGRSEFKKKGKKNLFEDIITIQTIEEDENLSQEEKNNLLDILKSGISPFEKRLRIMRALDRGKEFSSKIALVLRKNLGKMDMIEEIMLIFRDHYTKSDILKKDLGEVLTSGKVVKMMVSEIDENFWKSPYDKNGNIKRVLETSNGSGIFLWYVIHKFMHGLVDFIKNEDERYKFIIENMIYACEIQKLKMFNWLCIADIHDEYDLNVYCGSFLSVDKKGNYTSDLDGDFDKHMKEVWGINRVSLIISNPPYLKNLHLLFLLKSKNISDEVIFIHPSPWLFRNSSIKIDILDNLKKIKLINGNFYFNAEFGAPLSITILSKDNINEKIQIEYDTSGNKYYIDKINIPTSFWEPSKMMISLREKYLKISSNRNLSSLLSKNFGQDFIITTPRICGHAVNRSSKDKFTTNDFYTFFYKNSNLNNKETTNSILLVNSEIERKNLIELLKSKITRFGLYLNKLSQDGHIKNYLINVPIPDNLSVRYSEEDLCKLYNITNEEYLFIDKIIDDYYI
jgi:hypothetical protein